jgi:hypothetical protein
MIRGTSAGQQDETNPIQNIRVGHNFEDRHLGSFTEKIRQLTELISSGAGKINCETELEAICR